MPSHDIATILAAYPEQNPFLFDPPLFNLTPASQKFILDLLDTPEFLAAALAIAQNKYVNPLCFMYCTNPLSITDLRLREVSFPLVAYKRPPPLPLISLPLDTQYLNQLNKDGTTMIFTVRVDGEVRLLKIFHQREPDVAPNRDFPSVPNAEPFVELDRFEQEREAYAHLSHYRVCEKGVVPRCYGWLELSPQDLTQITSVSNASEEARSLARYAVGPLSALLLEYFPDAVRLTQDIATEELADIAIRGLAEIHSAYVLHGDVFTRNILVSPDNRVIFVDFDRSATPSGKLPSRRQDLLNELSDLWSKFYVRLLPNKRIGFYEPFDV